MALWTEIKPAELTAFSREAYAALDVGILNTILPNLYQDQVKFTWRVNAVLDGTALFGEFDLHTRAPLRRCRKLRAERRAVARLG